MEQPHKFSLTFAALIMLAGCSRPVVSDWANLAVLEDGDIYTGQGYTVIAENAVNVSASGGVLTPSGDRNRYVYHVRPELLEKRQIEFPFVDEFFYENPQGKKFSRRIRLAERDPLLRYQWHVYNSGRNYFKTASAPVKGVDLNLIPAWSMKDSSGEPVSGKGTVVAVLDLPADIGHEDLKNRLENRTISGDPKIVNTGVVLCNVNRTRGGELHGTSVAGLVSAEGFNGKGIRGVAYGSRFYSVSALLSPYEGVSGDADLTFRRALEAVLETGDTDVVNVSLGGDLFARTDASSDLIRELYARNVPLVHAAGNEYALTSWSGGKTDDRCLKYRTDCRSSVTDSLSRSPYVINVAAVNASGVRSSYSSSRPNMWISGLGGEDGFSVKGADAPGVVSTLSSYGCGVNRYDRDDDRSPWRAFGDQTCFYTAKMKGTSAAAPQIAGIIALMKQVRKELTVPQIRYILARSARNDKTFASFAYQPVTADRDLITDTGWTDVSQGLRYSARFGFGLADAAEAVRLAGACDADPACRMRRQKPAEIVFSSTGCRKVEADEYECGIAAGGADGHAPEAGQSYEIESAQLRFGRILPACIEGGSFKSFNDLARSLLPYYTSLQVELESPSGTVSVVKPAYAAWIPMPFLGEYDQKRSIAMAVSSFYRQRITSDQRFAVRIRNSSCELEPKDLEAMMRVSVEAYPIR